MTNLFFVSLARGITSIQVGAHLGLAAFYLLSTHGFRYVIKSQGWLTFPLSKLVAHVLAGIVILSFLNTIAQILINWVFNTLNPYEDFQPLVILVNLFTSFLYYALWSMMYFLYYFLDNYNTSLRYQATINEIKLNHLRNQLNPHFIFNALIVTHSPKGIGLSNGHTRSISDIEIGCIGKFFSQVFYNYFLFFLSHDYVPAIVLLSIEIPALIVLDKLILLK